MLHIGFAESETIEFKDTLSELDEGGNTICGFANQNGGVLYFGVKNNGEIIGIQSVADTTLRKVSQTLYDNLEPQTTFSVIKEKFSKHEVIKVTVEKNPCHKKNINID